MNVALNSIWGKMEVRNQGNLLEFSGLLLEAPSTRVALKKALPKGPTSSPGTAHLAKPNPIGQANAGVALAPNENSPLATSLQKTSPIRRIGNKGAKAS